MGILQFTDPESETYLGQFCREEINLSDASNVKIFEYMRTLVDGVLWSAQKQLEKPNQTGWVFFAITNIKNCGMN